MRISPPPSWLWLALALIALMFIVIGGPVHGQRSPDDWFKLVAELDQQFEKIDNEEDRRFVARMINELAAAADAMPTPAQAKWLLAIKAQVERGRR